MKRWVVSATLTDGTTWNAVGEGGVGRSAARATYDTLRAKLAKGEPLDAEYSDGATTVPTHAVVRLDLEEAADV